MDFFSTGGTVVKNSLDGLFMPRSSEVQAPTYDITMAYSAIVSGGTRTTQQTAAELKELLEKHVETREQIVNHHRIFDNIYKTSEEMRIEQQANFQLQLAEMQEIHRQELIDMFERSYAKPVTVTFIPENAQVEETIEDYILQSIETGKPLHELIPVTLLASLMGQ